jgi:hypothetical protein
MSELPDASNLEWLRKQAKRRLLDLREANLDAQLSDAQFDLAKQYGFSSWRALKAHVESLAVESQLFDAARNGDVDTLVALLDKHPDKLHARAKPYEWTSLHVAAQKGPVASVDLLLRRGLDVNTREKGDNTYAMHWAAAAGQLNSTSGRPSCTGVPSTLKKSPVMYATWSSCGSPRPVRMVGSLK